MNMVPIAGLIDAISELPNKIAIKFIRMFLDEFTHQHRLLDEQGPRLLSQIFHSLQAVHLGNIKIAHFMTWIIISFNFQFYPMRKWTT